MAKLTKKELLLKDVLLATALAFMPISVSAETTIHFTVNEAIWHLDRANANDWSDPATSANVQYLAGLLNGLNIVMGSNCQLGLSDLTANWAGNNGARLQAFKNYAQAYPQYNHMGVEFIALGSLQTYFPCN